MVSRARARLTLTITTDKMGGANGDVINVTITTNVTKASGVLVTAILDRDGPADALHAALLVATQ